MTGLIETSADRRAIALQEAQKTYALEYTFFLAQGSSVAPHIMEDTILEIAQRYDSYLSSGVIPRREIS